MPRAFGIAASLAATLLSAAMARGEEPAATTSPPPATLGAVDLRPAPTAEAKPDAKPDHAVGSPPPPSETGNGFSFGSYGRVSAGLDGRGHEGYATNVVSHGSRLEEPAYLELDMYYGGQVLGGRWRAVVAPAFGGDLFHYTGDFSSHFALRNGYVETEDIGAKGLRFWAGSRMYRGDDVYLFDYWPLDNLNTVGGGAGWRFGDNDVALHVGANRENDPFQFQTQTAPAHGLGLAVPAIVVDRPRVIASAKYTRYVQKKGASSGLKLSAYGELHYISDATRPLRDEGRVEALPSETGWVLGGQVGMWLRPYTFANFFFRYAQGIAAFGDLGLPSSSDPPRASNAAREIVGALSLNYETRYLGLMGGAFVRGWRDPDLAALSPRDYVEGAVALRPQLYVAKWFHVALEGSYQQRAYAGFDPLLDRRLAPKVFRFSVMPIISPLGKGTYTRPIIYAVYTASVLNQDARDALFDPTDVRYGASPAGNQTVHYVGLGAEWWFQSSYR